MAKRKGVPEKNRANKLTLHHPTRRQADSKQPGSYFHSFTNYYARNLKAFLAIVVLNSAIEKLPAEEMKEWKRKGRS